MSLKWQLSYAMGYLGLEMFDAARTELDQIEEAQHERSDVISVYIELFHQTKNWEELEPMAQKLIKTEPSDPSGWISLAYAVRRIRGLESAREILNDAREQHPECATVHYNLGCYACQMGELDMAEEYVRVAIAMEPHFQEVARKDDDLKPLHESGITFG